jgi:hypothetical protein
VSIEIWQFPRAATREELVAVLKSLGYTRGENLFFPGPPGTLSFFWSEPTDFLSTSGVDASVFPLDAEGKQVWNTQNDWALRTRTSISASSFDQEFQNKTVRAVRRAFGGTFYNDHFGHNRYNVVPPDKSTPSSRGIRGTLSRVLQDLNSLEHVLPEESIRVLGTPQGAITEENDKTGVLKFTKQFDPSRVLYNALLPFLVAAIEHIFRDTFEILVKYDKTAQAVLEAQSRKVSFADAAALTRGELSLEQIASDGYSFQNLDSIQRAYKDVLSIDIWKAIRRRRKIRKKRPMLSEALQELIGARHGVVHKFVLDRQLDRDGFLHLLELVRTLIDVVAQEVERKLGVPIEVEA